MFVSACACVCVDLSEKEAAPVPAVVSLGEPADFISVSQTVATGERTAV